MTSPDAGTSPGAAPDVSLRRVTPADDAFLYAVYASSREEEVAQTGWNEEQKHAFLRQQFDAQRAEYDARFPQARYDVILVDGQPAGRIWVGADAREIRLLDIALLPEYQNRGVGAHLVNQLIDEGATTARPLRHMVFILNTNARRFYERLGFVVFEEFGGAYLHMEWRPQQK